MGFIVRSYLKNKKKEHFTKGVLGALCTMAQQTVTPEPNQFYLICILTNQELI
jgi:hypothetical protein